MKAKEYFEHAKSINKLAGDALRLNSRDAAAIEAKISIGLSLQAAELALKAILSALGVTSEDLRAQFRNHNLVEMIDAAEDKLNDQTLPDLRALGRFKFWTPVIDDIEYGTTLAAYVEEHFSQGASAWPRNYFYPDQEVFTGPVPIHAVYVMVEYLIEISSQVIRVLDSSGQG